MTTLREAASRLLEAYGQRDYDIGIYMETLRAALAEQAEPVAWAITDGGAVAYLTEDKEDAEWELRNYGRRSNVKLRPLYTAPAAPQPLTDAEVKAMWEAHRAALPRYLCFARAIERAHGIGSKT